MILSGITAGRGINGLQIATLLAGVMLVSRRRAFLLKRAQASKAAPAAYCSSA